MTDYRDNLEIDLKNLAVDILKKWKLLVVGAIIGCLVGVLYIGTTNVVEVVPDEKPALLQKVSEQDMAALAKKLTVNEKSDVDRAFKAYKKAIELYDEIDKMAFEEVTESESLVLSTTWNIASMKSSFSADQKAYYTALFAADPELSEAVVGEIAEDATTAQAENAGVNAKSFIKYAAVGAFVGLFIVAVILALKYILTPVLKTEDDLRVAFRLPIIGSISSSSDTSTALIYSGIAACAQRAEAKKIYLVSSSDDEVITSNRNKMSSMFEGKEISVIAGGSMLTDPSVIDEIVTSDGVILFEKIGKSLYEDIAREIELCNNYGVQVFGTVVIK